ncbi:DUF4410 domain-containing protein [Geminicoccus flavidas]|uniref:DUF4410 domain-containing protein n=1 Tax=Geminicoccus flavidas TaxID=2506407 RepID=UPI001359E1D5|nr:DUF4410 domain-containing protein [Geminicoccus flavidas]
MRRIVLTGCMAAALVTVGCARTTVGELQAAADRDVTQPARILVYDFASDPADLPPDSAIAQLYQQRTTPQSEKEIVLGRRLGELTAGYLIEALNNHGIPAINGSTGPFPHVGDGVIRGAFVSINEGSRTKRMLIGFGAGAAELKTLVETYQVTATGLTSLGSGQIETAGGRIPGILVPIGGGVAAGTVATSAAISGAGNVLQEAGPESIEAAAKRTANEIANIINDAYEKRGWH